MGIEIIKGKLFLDGEEFTACPQCKMAKPKTQRYCGEGCARKHEKRSGKNKDAEFMAKHWPLEK